MSNTFKKRIVPLICIVVVPAIVLVRYISNSEIKKPEKNLQQLEEELSQIVQTQLDNLQNLNPRNCSVPTIYCGHVGDCGLGCQIHQRMACLMVSYAYNMPLIHDELHKWTYAKHWNEIFYPLGSSCTPGLLTRYIGFPEGPNVRNGSSQLFAFYLPTGIPVPKALADKVEQFHPNPFFWWLGQFMKYGLRLLPPEAERVRNAQRSLKFSRPIVGIHIRRSDKMSEHPWAFHEIKDYFTVAEEYFHNLTLQGVSFDVKRVFLATDDQSVIESSNKMYHLPEWEIIFFNHNRKLADQNERKDFLDEMITDLFTLADCDYVVCGYGSNVCGVLVGMLNFRHPTGPERLKSLDPYKYRFLYKNLPPNVVKV